MPSATFNLVVARRALPLQGRFEIPIHLIRPAATYLSSHVRTRAPCPYIEIPIHLNRSPTATVFVAPTFTVGNGMGNAPHPRYEIILNSYTVELNR